MSYTRALTILAAVQSALFAYYLHATLILQPYWDMYIYVMRYLQYRDDRQWWAYVFAPHVQHRLVWMRLLTMVDVELLHGTGYPFVVFATACLIVTAWLLVRQLPTDTASPRALRQMIGSLIVMLILTSTSAVDCSMPINTVYPQALMFVVLSIVLFEADYRIAALLAAAGAAFGSAVALPIWPILVWLAWRRGSGRRWMAIVAITGAAFIAAYMHGMPLVAAGTHVPDVAKMATYLVSYVGLPWTRSAALLPIGRLIGAILFTVAAAAVVWIGLFKQKVDRLQRIAVMLLAFSLASAVLAAIGRVDLEDTLRVPVRYAVFVLPLHVGLLFLTWPTLCRAWIAPARRVIIERVAISIACVLILQQIMSGQAAAATARSMRGTIQRFVEGETDAEMTTVIYIDLAQARRDLDTMHRAGLYLNAR